MARPDWFGIWSRPLVSIVLLTQRAVRAALFRNAKAVRDHAGTDAALALLQHGGPRYNPAILSALGAHVERDAMIHSPLKIYAPAGTIDNLSIGRGAHVGPDVFIDLSDRVTIGPNSTVSMRSTILTHFDAGRSMIARLRPRTSAPVIIDRDAYVGAGATILAGVTVGACAIVGAGAVVTGDVRPNDVVAGVPARQLSLAYHEHERH